MTFERAWVLIFLLLPAAFFIVQWRLAVTQRINVILKTLTFAAIILALAEPTMSSSETKVATVILVDTSAGLPDEDLARASDLVTKIDRASGRIVVAGPPTAGLGIATRDYTDTYLVTRDLRAPNSVVDSP